jgi:hypothetical protein
MPLGDRIFVALIVAVLAAFPATAMSQSSEPESRCKSLEPGNEFKGNAEPGVPLLSGIVSGMSKEEVKAFAPQLASRSGRIQLLPGLSLPGKILFDRRSRVSSILFTGSPARAPVEALTARFGSAIILDVRHRVEEIPSSNVPIIQRRLYDRSRTLKWCDGPRMFFMHLNDDEFRLRITGPRRSDSDGD